MEFRLPNRVSFMALILGAALAAMSVSIIGVPISLAVTPMMRVIENHANTLVVPTVTVMRASTVLLILLVLRLASARFASNAPLFSAARVVAIVYLADILIAFVRLELGMFFDVTVFNATQLELRTLAGGLFMTIVLPLIGVALLVAIAARFLRTRPE